MNLHKASILLDTINALYKRMEMKGGNVPAIERDLMLENIRELYEFFVTNEANAPRSSSNAVTSQPHPPRTTTPTPPPPPPPAPEPVREPVREVPTYNAPEPPKPPRRVERTSDYKPPRIIEIPDLKNDVPPAPVTKAPEYIPPTPPPPPPVPEPVKVVAPPPPPPAPEPVKVVAPTPPAPTADVPEFDTLFEHKAARELSEKLSERPIADLTRAVGYNDKMLYTNELFGGELVAFNSAVSRINSMGSFADARKHLAQLAEQNNWTEPNKTSSAKSFIKLVRRRFGA